MLLKLYFKKILKQKREPWLYSNYRTTILDKLIYKITFFLD